MIYATEELDWAGYNYGYANQSVTYNFFPKQNIAI